MADPVYIEFDGDTTKATRKLKTLEGDAKRAGSQFGKASSQAGRIGGAGGGMLGRGLGGFEQGTAAGFIGLGLAGVGVGINGFLRRDAEQVSAARMAVENRQKVEAGARTAVDRLHGVAAGGLAYAGKISRALTGGMSREGLAGYTKMASSLGLTSTEGIDIFEATKAYSGVAPTDIGRAMRTGLFGNADEAAKAIQQSGGLNNAIAIAGQMTPEQAGAVVTGQDSDPMFQAIGRARSANNPVENSQIDSLLSGATADVLEGNARDTLNPLAKIMGDAARQSMNVLEGMQAAAAAQSTFAGIMAEAGRLVGMSEGSEARKLGTYARGMSAGGN